MTCLIYGIVFSPCGDHARGDCPLELPAGVGGASVRLIEAGGLAAAVSSIEPEELTADLTRALSYAQVVEALHAAGAVLPMRYGCAVGEETQVAALLRTHAEEYAALLHGLEGCVEMGVRALLATGSSSSPLAGSGADAGPGHAYLTGRANRYAREENGVRALAAVTQRLQGALGGLAEQTRTEGGARATPGLASLYFLVRREAVESFRQAFQGMKRTETARLLLTGPWPPYNFADPKRVWEPT